MITIRYTTKRGAGAMARFNTEQSATTKIIWLFDRKIEATAENDEGEIVGRVWKDGRNWNYYMETSA